jgi:threonine dehydratase
VNPLGKKQILAAYKRIAPYIHRTPVLTSELLDKEWGLSLYFKAENFQKAGAFKSRGATNALLLLSDEQKAAGVITHSSGNHAGALARAAQKMGIPAYIIMPETAPKVKVNAVKTYGGKITFCKPTLEARESTLKQVQQQTGAVEIHPYNYLPTIEGQATAALEFLEQISTLDCIITPVGGGGLLSGSALTTHAFKPHVQVLAAEPAGADDAFRSFYSGSMVPCQSPDTIADGLLTSLGSLTFPIIQHYVSDIFRVQETTIISAMQLIMERMKIVVEPSAAVTLAAVMENPDFFAGKKTGLILSGGNIDLQKLPWNK